MEKSKLLSIVVPTRNRQGTAIVTINTLCTISEFNECEIIVVDNGDNDSLKTDLSELINKNEIKYVYSPELLSTGMNFDRAIPLITGDYCCFIGDDDGVNPDIILLLKELKERYDFDSLIDNRTTARYRWKNDISNGVLDVDSYTRKIYFSNVHEQLIKLLKDGGAEYQKFNLPKVYHGFTKSRIVKDIYTQYGHLFGKGVSPDLYSVVMLSSQIKEVLVYNYPLTISGSSPKSELTHRSKSSENITMDNAPHFRGLVGYKWSEYVPYVYSPYTVWAESCVNALISTGRTSLLKELDLGKLASQIVANNRKYEDEIRLFLKKRGIKCFWKYNQLLGSISRIKYKLNVKLERMTSGNRQIHISNIPTIKEAVIELKKLNKV